MTKKDWISNVLQKGIGDCPSLKILSDYAESKSLPNNKIEHIKICPLCQKKINLIDSDKNFYNEFLVSRVEEPRIPKPKINVNIIKGKFFYRGLLYENEEWLAYFICKNPYCLQRTTENITKIILVVSFKKSPPKGKESVVELECPNCDQVGQAEVIFLKETKPFKK